MQYPNTVRYLDGGRTAVFSHGKVPTYKTKQPLVNRNGRTDHLPKYPVGRKIAERPAKTRVRPHLGFVETSSETDSR